MKSEIYEVEEPAEEIPAEDSEKVKAETDMWATEAIKYFDKEYVRLLEELTTVRGQLAVKNIVGLKEVMDRSIHELIAQDLPDQIKRDLIKEAIESYVAKKDALLNQAR